MQKRIRNCLFAVSTLLLVSCGKEMKVEDFADTEPLFSPEIFFQGHTRSWGMVETIGGMPHQSFQIQADGYKQGGQGLSLAQHFAFDDSKTKDRHWHFIRIDDHHYEAAADDIVGTAQGEAYGNTFHLTYTLALTLGNPFRNVSVDQWMYLQDDGSVVSRAAIRKLGITVSQVTQYFQHVSDMPENPDY